MAGGALVNRFCQTTLSRRVAALFAADAGIDPYSHLNLSPQNTVALIHLNHYLQPSI
jgi:hypothetical protein